MGPEILDVIDINSGEKIDTISVPENIKKYFDYPHPEYLLHEVVVAYLANQRQGTHSTKTRAEVRGGGRKPWPQKHTGRARQGSIRSPLFRKGGIVFGPKPRDYYIKLPKKKKVIAKYLSLSEKIKSGSLIVVNQLPVEVRKTKDMVAVLNKLQLNSEKILLVAKEIPSNIKLATRNLQYLSVQRVNDLNAYVILNHNKLVITKEAMLCL